MHRFSGLVHGLYAAHFNSQVVSSALYAMARRFGDSKVAQFIHWMDGAVDSGSMLEVVSGESVAPVWRSFPRSQLDVVAASPGYWYRRRQAGQVVVDEVQELGQMIQNWAAEQGLEMVVMEKILRRRGLYKDETPAHQFEAAHFRYAN